MSFILRNPRVVLLGGGNVGKSSILMRYMHDAFSTRYNQTVEDLHGHTVSVDGHRFLVEILDTSGSLPFPAMRRLAIQNAHAFMLVYSVDSEESFVHMKNTWSEIKLAREDYKTLPCIIIGTKMDLENYRLVEHFTALAWAESNDMGDMLHEVSSKTGENISSSFDTLFRKMASCEPSMLADLKSHRSKRGFLSTMSNLFSCGRRERD